jgi:hypothetical protein
MNRPVAVGPTVAELGATAGRETGVGCRDHIQGSDIVRSGPEEAYSLLRVAQTALVHNVEPVQRSENGGFRIDRRNLDVYRAAHDLNDPR